MITVGIKFTHDGTIALAEDNNLIFSVEMEKINNNRRYSSITDMKSVDMVLAEFGYSRDMVDRWVIDGWQNDPELDLPLNSVFVGNNRFDVNVYQNSLLELPEENVKYFSCDGFGEYVSYSHVYSHLCASYCTSPFAERGEDAFVLMFDGGTKPTLYYFDITQKTFFLCGELMKFGGDIYPGLASLMPSFAYSRRVVNGKETFTHRFAGKIMAYIAKGKYISEIEDICNTLYDKLGDNNTIENGWSANRRFERELLDECVGSYSYDDILTTFHYFLQGKITQEVVNAAIKYNSKCKNLCLTGGSFLNIKWNSSIRDTLYFKEIFAPPFVSDTGVAIGAICAENLRVRKQAYMKWHTYLGMKLKTQATMDGWKSRKCDVASLAELIYQEKELVVVLHGRTELGPRALGNRSIIADARFSGMKDKLNEIKQREEYRPVAPICLEEDAKQYFTPGTVDKHMLFEHKMTEYGMKTVPAVMHLDGTARVQTVSALDNPLIYKLLCEYKKISGVSVLCNTSANDSGNGFFPDVESAQRWGKCKYIWSDGVLYSRL